MKLLAACALLALPASAETGARLVDGLVHGQRTLDLPGDAAALHAYVTEAEATDERLGWAQLFLGRALKQLGYTHAAAVTFARIATERTNPDAVAPAVAELKALLALPHDEALIDEGVFGTLDVASLPDETRQLAHYQQGLADLKAGRERWAKAHFDQLPATSPEWARARLAVLVTRTRSAQEIPEKLVAGFDALSKREDAPAAVRRDAQLAVARLRYERHEYAQALEVYRASKPAHLDPGRSALYMEEAWASYRMGDLEAALGMLTTLDAPVFKDELVPDKYLLRAIIYRERCHWLPARRAARELTRRFATTLEAVRERRDLLDDAPLRRAALSRGAAQRAEQFLGQVAHEADALAADRDGLGEAARRWLEEVYGVAVAEATRVRDQRLEVALEREADRLLGAAEQVRLIEYEVGDALYARAKRSPGKQAPTTAELFGPDDVGFDFSGEYWNDELKDLRVTLEDRCAQELL